ncbi:MAG: hypothetical protein QM802_03170 [Agriterribacter sp.]
MTRDSIEDYLYFFWAPLLEAGVLSPDQVDDFQKMIILTLSQSSVYIEAPDYKPGSTRNYSDDIKNDITQFSDKIFANIAGRSPEDNYWLAIHIAQLLPASAGFADMHLEAEKSYGAFEIAGDNFISFDFYKLTNQLQIQLPVTSGISAIVSTATPIVLPDGAVTQVDLEACSIWLCASHIDHNVNDPSLYIGLRLKKVSITLDGGFTKSGNHIGTSFFHINAAVVITCIPADVEDDGIVHTSIAAANSVLYPNKFVFTLQNHILLPSSSKTTLTHAEPFSCNLLGTVVETLVADNENGNWVADKSLLSFPLQVANDEFDAIVNTSPIFNIEGSGKITNISWRFATVSITHPLAFGKLGVSAESGYIAFDIASPATLSWSGLENPALKVTSYSLRSSPDKLFIDYSFNPSKLAKQDLALWQSDEQRKGRSVIHTSYTSGGNGNLISHRKSYDQHIINNSIDIDLDRPLLSNGSRVFMKTDGVLMLINDNNIVTAVIIGTKMNAAAAFESSLYQRLSSFVLSNALVIVNPPERLIVVTTLNEAGIGLKGACILNFPIYYIEHMLPDPYITNLFNDQQAVNPDPQNTQQLKSSVHWDDAVETILDLKLSDASGVVFIPQPTLTDDQMADRLLQFPLPHPVEKTYDTTLQQWIGGGSIETDIFPDSTPYGSYQSSYHVKTNTTGAFSTLHILPGNTFLVDVSGRAAQMGVAFSGKLNNTENGIAAVLANTGYDIDHTFRIEKNELVSSGRFVRAFTLPHVQWEPVYYERKNDLGVEYSQTSPFAMHGAPTRIASADKADVALAPVPITGFIVDAFKEENGKFAAAAHFGLPFGMDAVALFHPMVANVVLPPNNPFLAGVFNRPDPYSYSLLYFNQPLFSLKKTALTGNIQVAAKSIGYPAIPRDGMPDPSFQGSVLQLPDSFSTAIDNRLSQVIAGTQSATAILANFLNGAENADFVNLNNVSNDGSGTLIQYLDDSILGIPITRQFNRQMWGEQTIQSIRVDKINKKAFVSLRFNRSNNAKVPLRRIDFSGIGASIFSNWLNESATAGAVSQVKFNILIGRVAHEVIQIKSVIIPWFIPVVRTLIIERKNHGNIIRTDSGWVATGPGEFHDGYIFHPGVVKGVYNVTSIKDTAAVIQQAVNGGMADMSGVYFDADVKLENVAKGFKSTGQPGTGNYKLVASKKQFGYIILGNPDDGVTLQQYFPPFRFNQFMSRGDVGALGGPVDCVINIAGSDQLMHITRVDVTAVPSGAFVAAAKGTLQFPKAGSWSVVKKITGGAVSPLSNDEIVPLIRNGVLNFNAGLPVNVSYNGSLHVLGNVVEIEKYVAGGIALASTEYALLQSTDTQKLLFPRPSFNSNGDAVITDGITEGLKKIFTTNPVIADPYSILKSNSIFPDNADVLTLGNVQGFVKSLDVLGDTAGISFPPEVSDALKGFTPAEYVASDRQLFLVNQGSFQIYIDYGDGTPEKPKQQFSIGLDGSAEDYPASDADPKKWEMVNKDVAIVVNIDVFKPLIVVKGKFSAAAGQAPEFSDATIEWGGQPALQKIVEVLTILYALSTEGGSGDIVKDGFTFAMGNSPDSWSYKCTIEEKIPVLKFPTPVQLSQLPGPAPLIVEAGLNLGVFFNLSLSTDPDNLIKAGAGIALGFEATIQVLLLSLEVASVYGVGSARVDIYIELPDAKPTFKFTMGFGATVAVQLPVIGYVSITRVMSLGASIDSNGMEMTAGQMLRGVVTVAGGLASVSIQVEASGTVTDKKGERAAIVRGVFSLDITVAWVLSWDFSKEFEHTIDLPNPF